MPRSCRSHVAFLVPLVAILLFFSVRPVAWRSPAQPPMLAERFTANAVDLFPMGLPPRSSMRPSVYPVDIGIERWSTDADVEQIIKALRTGGRAAVVQALDSMRPIGYIYYPSSWADDGAYLRWNLKYACETTTDNDERRLVLATAEPDSSLKVIEIRFARNGVGEGRIAREGAGIALSKDQRTIQLVVYKEAQICLKDVRK